MHLKLASFFSGAGGLDTGFHNAGFTVEWSNEFNKQITPTLQANFPYTHIDNRSLTNIQSTQIPDKMTGLVGAPPCQSWSLGGHGKGLEDKRGHVFLDYIRVINDKQPLFFLAENVKGMLAKTRQKDLQQILNAFDKLGYNITYQLVNAHDYNVPQDRWRLFFVGYRKDTNLTFTFPEPNPTKPTLKNTIWDLRNTATPALDKDKTNRDIEIANHEYSTGTFSSQYMSRNRVREWNQPSFTIQASGRQAPLHPDSGKMRKINNDLYEFDNPENYRRLSVRETARIQTFPDTYQFKYNTLDLGYKMIGNAVPVNLAEAMANKIKQDLQTL